jgi:energy-coupling factor transporter transmembrane protein EcfT
LSLAYIFSGLRHFAFFFFVLALFPAIFSDGTPLAISSYIPFSLSIEGLISGGTAVLRFIVIVLISMILTRTIHPLDIVKSMESMMPKKYIGDGPLYDFFRVGLMSMQVIPYLFGEVEKFADSNRLEWENVRGLNKYSRMIGLVLPFLIHIFKSMDQMEAIIDSGQKT